MTHHEHRLDSKRITVLATDGVERVELTEPWQALEQAGAKPELISNHPGEIEAFDHFDRSEKLKVERTSEEVSADEYDALLLPGGVAKPDILRTDENVVHFVREFFEQGKPVAAICHGPWTLVEAAVVRGRTLTSWPSLQTDIRNAGGTWVDEEVVVDGDLVTSRKPDDLPRFIEKTLELFAAAERAEQRAAATQATG